MLNIKLASAALGPGAPCSNFIRNFYTRYQLQALSRYHSHILGESTALSEGPVEILRQLKNFLELAASSIHDLSTMNRNLIQSNYVLRTFVFAIDREIRTLEKISRGIDKLAIEDRDRLFEEVQRVQHIFTGMLDEANVHSVMNMPLVLNESVAASSNLELIISRLAVFRDHLAREIQDPSLPPTQRLD
jgi:hypothetical protein